jgi:peptidoglycan/LPS O-acetylase OafA/YrhL
MALTFVLSVLTFIVVERPAINLGKRIIRWRYSVGDKTPQAIGAPYHD